MRAMTGKRKHKATRKTRVQAREALNYECMSKIIVCAQAYLDGIDHIGATCFKIHDLVQRIVEEHVK